MKAAVIRLPGNSGIHTSRVKAQPRQLLSRTDVDEHTRHVPHLRFSWRHVSLRLFRRNRWPSLQPSLPPSVISIFAKMYSKSRRAEELVLQSLRLSTEFNYVELVTKWKNIKYVVCAKISSTFVMTNEYPTDIAFVTQSARLKSMDFRGLHARYEEKLYSFRREISFARVNIMEIMEFWRVLYLNGWRRNICKVKFKLFSRDFFT